MEDFEYLLKFRSVIRCLIGVYKGINYGGLISKRLDITYCIVVKHTRELENRGFLTRERKGRMNYLKLTEKGEFFAKRYMEMETYG